MNFFAHFVKFSFIKDELSPSCFYDLNDAWRTLFMFPKNRMAMFLLICEKYP